MEERPTAVVEVLGSIPGTESYNHFNNDSNSFRQNTRGSRASITTGSSVSVWDYESDISPFLTIAALTGDI